MKLNKADLVRLAVQEIIARKDAEVEEFAKLYRDECALFDARAEGLCRTQYLDTICQLSKTLGVKLYVKIAAPHGPVDRLEHLRAVICDSMDMHLARVILRVEVRLGAEDKEQLRRVDAAHARAEAAREAARTFKANEAAARNAVVSAALDETETGKVVLAALREFTKSC